MKTDNPAFCLSLESKTLSVYGYDQPRILVDRIVAKIANHWKNNRPVALILASIKHKRTFEIALSLSTQPQNYIDLLYIGTLISNPHDYSELIYEDIDAGISQQRFNSVRYAKEGLSVSIFASKKTIKRAFSKGGNKKQLKDILHKANELSGANVDFREWYRNH